MRPVELSTKIFLDSGSALDTKSALDFLGFLDGQTTNPTLVSQNLKIKELIDSGVKFSKKELNLIYKEIIEEIKSIIPQGLISIEVYCDLKTKSKELIDSALEYNSWIKNAYIKLPITKEALIAGQYLSKHNVNLNFTLCFSQMQAAAVYAYTKNSNSNIIISPFLGRLEDNCKDGVDLIMNIQRMFNYSDKHVGVLVASIRDYKHFLYSLFLKPEYITAPVSVLNEWSLKNFELPSHLDESIFADKTLYFKEIHDSCITGITYKEIDLNMDLSQYNAEEDLTHQGIKKFSNDWNSLLK